MNRLKSAKRTIRLERDAIDSLIVKLDHHFDRACEIIMGCTGKVCVTGMGKSGHIASKIASTLSSTGTPAYFLHPGEACHGDLGMLSPNDIILALSNSGETREIIDLLQMTRDWKTPIIGISSRQGSSLARIATAHLWIDIKHEACPLGLAPTSSTTAALVLGDALAICCLEERNFTIEDFARVHPGGSLGKQYAIKSKDLMRTHDLIPSVQLNASLSDALIEMSNKGLGMTLILNENKKIAGIFTDGDLRRALNQKKNIHHQSIRGLMTNKGISIPPDLLASKALAIMQHYKITTLIVCDLDEKILGVLSIHDIMQAGISSLNTAHANQYRHKEIQYEH